MNVALNGWRQRLAYQGLLLGTVALLTSSALLFANRVTAPQISARNAEDLAASLAQALPGIRHDNELLNDTVRVNSRDGTEGTLVYRARYQGAVQAVVFENTAYGYAGAIRLVMGIDRDGKILSVRVLSHRETPGLGDKIEIGKSQWIERFSGLSLGNPPVDQWKVKKDGGEFDQFTGATITPRSVVKGVKEGLELFATHRAAMLGEQQTGAHP
jgi:electron transport complex protein RnfG